MSILRPFVQISLVTLLARQRHIEREREYGTFHQVLLELPLLRLDTDGATTATEVGGDIVKSAVRAPGKSPKA